VLNTPTYDGSGQAMHPAIVGFDHEWHGFSYWLSVTPYPSCNSKFENPSILASHDGVEWEVPSGLTNPVASYEASHLMDSDLLYDPGSDSLWLYYLRASGQASLLRRTSSDGVHWSGEEVLLSVPYNTMVSPAVEEVGGKYDLWSVNAAGIGCNATKTQVEYRSSRDGTSWSPPITVDLRQPGSEIWHIDVSWIPAKREYWALYAAYADGQSCGKTSLYFAKSFDGQRWTSLTRPLLAPGSGWDAGEIYRATLLYDAPTDTLRVWYSAQHSCIWHTGYVQTSYSSLSGALQQ
jgi:hypothetical protein